jgi:hypothetical protein
MKKGILKEEIYQNLPESIKELTAPFQDRERDIVLLSSLGVLSASLPRVYGIYDSNRYSPHLYLLIIAPPASGKGAMGKSKKLIEKIHREIKQISLDGIADCKENQKDKKNKSAQCPELEIKLVPGNVSSSKIYKHLQNSPHGILIFETEADTISTMLKQDWGNFSDVLRKSFHHETVSISREIEDKYFEISEPKLSLVLSGTPNQVSALINSQENGLFSRFVFYYFDEPSYWKDVSPQGETIDTGLLFSNAGTEILKLYNKLIDKNGEVEVRLTQAQWNRFNERMDYIVKSLIEIKKTDILPTIKRNGVIMFRICMILTVIRNKDNIDSSQILYCDNKDFNSACAIIESAIDHSIVVSNLLSSNLTDPKKKLNMRESLMLSALGSNFKKKDALIIGKYQGIPDRSIDFIIAKLIRLQIIEKISNGVFQKKDIKKSKFSQESQESQLIQENITKEKEDGNEHKNITEKQGEERPNISDNPADN